MLTLRAWRTRFLSQLDAVRALGFDDRFIRMWDYYLAISEAGFKTGLSQDHQLVFEKRRALAVRGPRRDRSGRPLVIFPIRLERRLWPILVLFGGPPGRSHSCGWTATGSWRGSGSSGRRRRSRTSSAGTSRGRTAGGWRWACARRPFTTLVAALSCTRLVPAVADPQANLTVFAPTDAAFAKFGLSAKTICLLPKSLLSSILLYHVAPGRLYAADVLAARRIPTLNGGFCIRPCAAARPT